MTDEMCPTLEQSPAPEFNYFIQMVPCVDQSSGRKSVYRNLREDVKLPPILLDDIRDSDTHLNVKEITRLISAGMKDTWLLTGEAFGEPYWAAGFRYEQTWTRQGTHRGRLVATVPLGLQPASRKISIKTWETRQRKATDTDLMESIRTTEIIGNQRISVSAQKQILQEQSAQYNPTATVNNISIPVKGLANVGAGGKLGISATFGNLNRDTVTRGLEFIKDTTLKAVESLKSARTIVIEEETTSGSETTTTEELANPNRVNTLSYLYYELEEKYLVEVAPISVDLYLHIPLPVDHIISKQWLLVNECLVRPYVDCAELELGFDAARKLVAIEKLAVLEDAAATIADGPATPNDVDDDLKAVISAIETAISSFKQLKNASLTKASFGRWLYWQTLMQFSQIIADAYESLTIYWNSLDQNEKTRSAVVEAVTTFKQDIGNIGNAFLAVNVAVNVIMGVGGVIAYGPFIPFIYLMAQAADSVGADFVPDDANLERKSELMIIIMESLLRTESKSLQLDIPLTGDADGDTEIDFDAIAIERERLIEQRRIEIAQAETAFEALQTHIRERKYFFHQIIWSHHDNSWIEYQLMLRQIPPQLFELRFASFEGEYGALRLVNLSLAEQMGFDGNTLIKWQEELAEINRGGKVSYTTYAPAPGVIVEPMIGSCTGGDPFVETHRGLDVKRAEAEVRKLEAEADLAEKEVERLTARLAENLLDDPTPYDGVDRVTIHPPTDDPGD